MYLDFFQIQREPFQVTPDPAFFYFSPGHREALAALIYGVEQRKGFIALTGEVGVGKTTILRAFLERIDQAQTKVIYLLNANVAFDDLLKMLLQEFGTHAQGESSPRMNGNGGSTGAITLAGPLPREEGDKTENAFQRVNKLHRLLIEHFRQDRNVVLIIDEAQNMPAETLEGLRTLSNLETATDKLLQIIFCGQPEFDEQLARPELRQLKQRIAVRATVKPLTDAEGIRYIKHRLCMAGVPKSAIFTPGAIRQILQEAQGIPRLINILCDNALVTAFGYQARQVKASVVKEIIADRKIQAFRRPARWRIPAIGIATAIMLAGVFLIGVIAPLPRGGAGLGTGAEVSSSAIVLLPAPAETPRLRQVLPITDHLTAPVQPILATVPGTSTVDAPAKVSEHNTGVRMAADQPAHATTAEPVAAKMSQPEPVTRVVKPGDRLLDLVEDVYGTRDQRLVQLVKRHNSQLRRSHLIRIGDLLVFPPDARQESTQ